MTQTHGSSLLKYRISYPDGWTVTTATKPWVFGGQGDEAGDPTVDEFHSPGPAAFYVSSQQLPPGMTLPRWIRAYMGGGSSWNPACWPPPATWPTMHIAGHVAKVHGGVSYCNFTEAVTVVDGRAFVFTASPDLERCCNTFDPYLFQALLATVKFPGDATDSPSASPSG
jgi:hypothetical protein